MLEVEVICLYDEHFSLIICNPFFIPVIKIAQILDADALFVVEPAFLDL